MTQSVYHHASVPAWHSAPATYTPFTDYLNLDHYNVNAPSAVIDHVVPDDDRRYSSSASPSSPSRALNHHGFEATSWESSTDLYRFSAARPSQSPLTSPEPDPDAAQVKQEEEQDDFVFENPPTTDANMTAFPAVPSLQEVPLRATQASKEMRLMMGVFRLDPFTMHNAVRDPTSNLNWNGEPIGPLRQEPTTLEFQLEIVADASVKDESAPDLCYPPENAEPSRGRGRLSSTYASANSPAASVDYVLLETPSASPLEERDHAWSSSSSSLAYSPDMQHQQPYSTVPTPADGLNVSMGLNYKYPSTSYAPSPPASSLRMPHTRSSLHPTSSLSYSTSSSPPLSYLAPSPPSSSSSPSFIHPSASVLSSHSYPSSLSSFGSAQQRQGLAYSAASPVRLPLPASSRYGAHASELHVVGTGDSGSSIGGGENADSMWLRKSYSLAMFYGKDATGGSSGLNLAPPHAMSSLAARRMASSSLGSHHDGSRAERNAWP